MQQLMLRLDRVVRRRRALVLALWLVALIAALPFAAKQSDHLTGGGYTVPDSQSDRVAAALERQYGEQGRGTLAAVVVPERRASSAEVREGVMRMYDAARAEPDVVMARADRDRALAAAERAPGRTLVVPLRLAVDDQDAIDVATGLRERAGLGDAAGGDRAGDVTLHLVGQGAL